MRLERETSRGSGETFDQIYVRSLADPEGFW